MLKFYLFLLTILFLLNGCSDIWNNPYPNSRSSENALYSAFTEQPKHLDPAKSYSSNEWVFVQSVYDSPLQYHYLKRPYTLEPNILSKMPERLFYDNNNQLLPQNTSQTIAYSDYVLSIIPGVLYQPHPSFIEENLKLSQAQIQQIYKLDDLKKTSTREVIASDFVHQIKRLAHPALHSPILSVMKEYIVGLSQTNTQLLKDYKTAKKQQKTPFLNLTKYDISGVEVLNKYQYKIRIKGHQPQFLYWLAMPFFTAIPPEADSFYAQKGLLEKNISLEWYPVGTGAFYLSTNNPNKEMVLTKNPNFRHQTYPTQGSLKDKKLGLLADAGKPLPLVDKIYFSLERESIPYWHKFLQGYYDRARVSSEHFDQAISIDKQGEKSLSNQMQVLDIRLIESKGATIYYASFNFADSLVGGNSEQARLLRQAIATAVDMETYVSIFLNGQASIAHHPVPKGFFGFDDKPNPQFYEAKFDDKRQANKVQKKSLAQARVLLEKAGYTNGINPKTAKALTLSFNTTDIGPDAQARLSWIKNQFNKLGINLLIDATNYSTFLNKIRKGDMQIFESGWGADYPDAQNFLFLFYSPNGKLKYGGDNSANYHNSQFDELFKQMKNIPNNAARKNMISQMIKLWQHDTPWAWAYTPNSSVLAHSWVGNVKPNAIAKNTLKYQKMSAQKRLAYQQKHNKIAIMPLIIFAILLGLVLLSFYRKSRNK